MITLIVLTRTLPFELLILPPFFEFLDLLSQNESASNNSEIIRKVLMGKILTPDELESLMRQGLVHEVRSSIQSLSTGRIPRALVWRYCNIARRVNLVNTALRLANPIVRPLTVGASPATIEERAEYSAALIRIGAISEAQNILASVEAQAHPESLLYLAFAAFAQWDYRMGLQYLKRAEIHDSDRDPYFRLLVKVNMAACLVFEKRWAEAEVLLGELYEKAREREYRILEGNVLELFAQSYCLQENFSRAHIALKQAKELLSETPTLDRLFVEKWSAITNLYEKPFSPETEQNVRKVQELAVSRRHWETVRDCDFHLARRFQSQEIFTHLYFGTPLKAYRDRLFSECPELSRASVTYPWALGGASPETASSGGSLWLSTADGIGSRSIKLLKTGNLTHRIFVFLTSDFYRPLRIGSIFSSLFQDEFFDPFISPNRVHQAIRKLRAFFRSNRLPLQIQAEDGAYSLSALRPIVLLVKSSPNFERSHPDKGAILISKVFDQSPEPLNSNQIAARLNVSKSTATRILRASLRNGAVEAIGTGKEIKYRKVI